MFELTVEPSFRGFDAHAAVRVYRRNLPHWRQNGATYFVTFRLADSIPRRIVLAWQEQDRIWLKANGIEPGASGLQGWKLGDDVADSIRRQFERRLAHRLHVELDKCHGACLLRRAEVRDLLGGALRHFDAVRWWVGDFVVMPNHVHGLFKPAQGHELEDVLASVKGFVSTRLSQQGVKTGRFWQQENYDRIVRDTKELQAYRDYIARNPAKAGLTLEDVAYHRCTWLDL